MNFLRNPQEALEISSLMGLQNINKLLSLALKKIPYPQNPKAHILELKCYVTGVPLRIYAMIGIECVRVIIDGII